MKLEFKNLKLSSHKTDISITEPVVTISEPEIANIETTPIEAVSNDSAFKNQVDS